MNRRGLLSCLALPLLGSCGFRPVYGPGAGGAAGAALTGLAEINVPIIPERAGQLLRQALQERFERGGGTPARRFDLTVAFRMVTEGIAIQRDSSTTRIRVIGVADWKLVAQDAQRSTLIGGTARNVDGLNVLNEQYFASDLENEVVQRRVAEGVADQIAYQLAAYFNKRAAQG